MHLFDLDKIIHKDITHVEVLLFDSAPLWIAKVLISFDSVKLMIAVDSNTDELILTVDTKLSLQPKKDEYKISNIEELNKIGLGFLIGQQLIWFWKMVNNQGYFDAI